MKNHEISIPEKHLISIHGNDIPTFSGMVNIAHQLGLQSIDTTPLQLPSSDNGNTVIFKSTVTLKNGIVCSAIGDATPENVPPACRNSFIRVASTRATSRAIGLACNVGDLNFYSEPVEGPVIDVEYSSPEYDNLPSSEHRILPQGIDKNTLKGGGNKPITEKQRNLIESKSRKKGLSANESTQKIINKNIDELTGAEADIVIKSML